MRKLTTTYSNSLDEQKLNIDMVEKLGLQINVKTNPFNFLLGDLFLVGARKNPKRNFLFVSQLIGKHISVAPEVPLLTGYILGNLYTSPEKVKTKEVQDAVDVLKGNKDPKEVYDMVRNVKTKLEKPTLFLGFAETATGLGNAVFEAFEGQAEYIHTTREDFLEMETSFTFEEEHSHATSHRCYGPDPDYFERFDEIVLVDDEVTTGNTALNLIRALNQRFPNKKYSVLSILDWRQEEDVKRVQKTIDELNVPIEFVSFIQGEVSYTNQEMFFEDGSTQLPKKVQTDLYEFIVEFPDNSVTLQTVAAPVEMFQDEVSKIYIKHSGRFSVKSEDQAKVTKICSEIGTHLLSTRKSQDKTLCLGTGEFMHIPALISSYMGEGIKYHSTTRSPIHVVSEHGYPVKNAFSYPSYKGKDIITHYLYNILPNQYEEVFMFFDGDVYPTEQQELSKALSLLGVRHAHFIVLT